MVRLTAMINVSLSEQIAARPSWPQILSADNQSRDALLLRCVDGLLAAVLFSSLLFGGESHALGSLVLSTLTLVLAACWCVRQALSRASEWIWSSAEYLLLAAVALVALQLAPLPAAVLRTLSPSIEEILPLWSSRVAASARLGVWSCPSLAPVETWHSLIVLGTYAVLFLITVQRIRETDDVERLLRWGAVAGTGMAAFGLTRYLGSGEPLNNGSLAHFLILALGPSAWWILKSLKDAGSHTSRRSPFFGSMRLAGNSLGFRVAALGLCVLVVLMPLSSGSIAVMFLATAVCLAILHQGNLVDGRTLLLFLGAELLVAVSLGIVGCHLASDSAESASGYGGDIANQGRGLWRADLLAAADYCWLGSGAGSHAQVCPMYAPGVETSSFRAGTQAQCSFLQIAVEAGIPGLLLVLLAFALIGYWCLAVLHPGIFQRELACFAGIIPGLCASLAHSLVDVVWSSPGCMVMTVFLGACACRLSQMVRCNDRAPLRPAPVRFWPVAALAVVVLGCLVIPGRFGAVVAEPSWRRAVALWRQLNENGAPGEETALNAIIEELSRVVSWQPDHAQAQAMLAEARLRLFRQVQGPGGLDVRAVRDAVVASRFASRAALEVWLSKNVGQWQHLDLALEHACRAAALCPTDGENYVRLAALTFLDGPNAPDKELCLQQAVKLRPFDGTMLFQVGQESMLAGDSQSAYAFWAKSFQCGRRHQQRLIQLLAVDLPAATFLQMFPMDGPAFSLLETEYRRLRRPADLKEVLTAHAQIAGRNAAKLTAEAAVAAWMEAARAYGELGETDACVASLQQALRWDPSNYEVRHALGRRLFEAKRYPEADEHLVWCRQRKRYDSELRAMVDTIAAERLRVSRQPALLGPN